MELEYVDYDYSTHENKSCKLLVNPSAIICINSDNVIRFTDSSMVLITEESAEKVRAYLRDVNMLHPF